MGLKVGASKEVMTWDLTLSGLFPRCFHRRVGRYPTLEVCHPVGVTATVLFAEVVDSCDETIIFVWEPPDDCVWIVCRLSTYPDYVGRRFPFW